MQQDPAVRRPAAGQPPKPPLPRAESEIIAGWQAPADAPLVSVVCLTFNHGRFFTDTMHGFLMQETRFPFEIVVHDDASRDNTADVVASFAAKYPTLVRPILQKTNQYSAGVNVLKAPFAAARGKYIAYCEGDDYWVDPAKLQRQVDFLEAHPEYVVCYSDLVAFSDEGVVAIEFGGARRDLAPAELQRAAPLNTLTACFRNIVEFPPEFTLAKYADRALWSLLGHHGAGKYLPEAGPCYYRVHGAGLHSTSSQITRSQMLMQTACALFSYYQRIGNKELAEYFGDLMGRMSVAGMGISPRLIPMMRGVSAVVRRGAMLGRKG